MDELAVPSPNKAHKCTRVPNRDKLDEALGAFENACFSAAGDDDDALKVEACLALVRKRWHHCAHGVLYWFLRGQMHNKTMGRFSHLTRRIFGLSKKEMTNRFV